MRLAIKEHARKMTRVLLCDGLAPCAHTVYYFFSPALSSVPNSARYVRLQGEKFFHRELIAIPSFGFIPSPHSDGVPTKPRGTRLRLCGDEAAASEGSIYRG